MCRPDSAAPAPLDRRPPLRLLLTHESFVLPDAPSKDDAGKRRADPSGGPSPASTLLTAAVVVAALFALERLMRDAIAALVGGDPVLGGERSLAVLGRHLGADFVALAACALVGLSNRAGCRGLISMGRSAIGDDGLEDRVFGYHPGAQRLMMIFFAYQVKNLYDSIYWDEGIVFISHHIFAGFAAWGGMFPGYCHSYALFYFGLSEISTAILALLASFEPERGVDGLDEVFPKTKIFLGALFIVTFIVCRVIMWPFVTFHYFRDVSKVFKSNAPLLKGRRGYIMMNNFMLSSLTLIQVVFVGMIVQTGREEMAKLMNPEI